MCKCEYVKICFLTIQILDRVMFRENLVDIALFKLNLFLFRQCFVEKESNLFDIAFIQTVLPSNRIALPSNSIALRFVADRFVLITKFALRSDRIVLLTNQRQLRQLKSS